MASRTAATSAKNIADVLDLQVLVGHGAPLREMAC
jgi:hypothetical protein